MQDKIKNLLLKVNKPSRYTGKEIGSFNKDWDEAQVRVNIAFPDLYEIGISNLGHRILYHVVNSVAKNCIADRCYAPDIDFKELLKENKLPLCGVETSKPLKEFDIVAFSLQYELNFPTFLAMLDMGKIPVESKDRDDNDPIIISGGPCSLNPEPVADFVDAFIIGDGEEIFVEILEMMKKAKKDNLSREEKLKNLAKLEGIYIPKFYSSSEGFKTPKPISPDFPQKINKRIVEFDCKNYPVNFPVPYLSSVHDRAVIEIRRGCGRMCRFCQSCFANLPVREREPEKIIDLTEKVLNNTGYDEYSLLSLSSSDYRNIEPLVCELNNIHAPTGASISLPSQRADAFSISLANEVQSVRKSTLTFAPEAGSQRLRDVINKNLNEEQILKAVLSAYQAGWNSIKLYFMIGLPTETFEDLDEMINLMIKIKEKGRELKAEAGLHKHLDITCTISIFVPKAFTPFQWFGQDNLETINEKVRYLKNKIKYVKGIKLNCHETFVSHLEAVFARGDKTLGKLIKNAWQKGAYLDAWTEYFDKKLWLDAAQELNIDFHDFSSKKIMLDSELPWDIINVGIDKNWLINEYNKSIQNTVSVPCDERCADCGICESFNKKPQLTERNYFSAKTKNLTEENETRSYNYRLKIQKTGDLIYISHLDWQRLLYRAFRKAKIDLNFTQGFNPQPKISIGLALPLFVKSISELVDIEIKENMQESILLEKLNKVLPDNSKILKIVKTSKEEKSVDRTVCWAKYTACTDKNISSAEIEKIIQKTLEKESILIEKQKHKGPKKLIDIRPSIYSANLIEGNENNTIEFVLKTGQGETVIDLNKPNVVSLRADDFMKFLTPDINWSITREKLYDCNLKELV